MKNSALFSKGKIPKSQKIIEVLKIFSRSTGPVSTKFGTKHTWIQKMQGLTNKDHLFHTKEILFSRLISVLILIGFSCERSGSWASFELCNSQHIYKAKTMHLVFLNITIKQWPYSREMDKCGSTAYHLQIKQNYIIKNINM